MGVNKSKTIDILVLCLVLALNLELCTCKTVTVPLVISEGAVAPDNYEQTGILINGQFPGPPIVVDKNDIVVLQVVNLLPRGFAMHMHGVLQRGTHINIHIT